ncbi:MAG: decaprenyl-phosphate phosphoribosyltransferase [Ignavibacteria bacterium]|nr:decaprenyl-phosphate phosphoribosyltransferase [Ignavibacteria bacterium]
MFRPIFISLRPEQWIKNFFLFAPLVFARHLNVREDVIQTILGFITFSFLSSSVYLFNDVADAERDKLHPEKNKRPIPSGLISKQVVSIIAILLMVSSISFAFMLKEQFGIICASYVGINILYSWKLKHIVILDVMLIAFGFVLRVLGGAALINVPVTGWILLCTFLLSLFLVFNKRRNEMTTLNENAEAHRLVLEQYSVTFLDQMISIVTGATIVAYAFYTLSEETVQKFQTTNLIYTVPFVLFGMFRYLFLVHKKDKGGNPTKVMMTDKQLIVNFLLWMVAVYFIIYGQK